MASTKELAVRNLESVYADLQTSRIVLEALKRECKGQSLKERPRVAQALKSLDASINEVYAALALIS